ncbi:MAG: tetratricopeptide repeat protein [Candidatus Sulfotelmatobacter sp.]
MGDITLAVKPSDKPGEHLVAQSTWIYNPWLDLIVGCGAWSAPLLLISYLSVASSVRAWSIIFYILAFFFNYPHYMATIYRAYHRPEDFQKYRIFTVHITALIALTLILSHSWARVLPWIFTIYLTWSPWHYSGQNYGLFMMFARRAGAKPSDATRRALYGAFIVSYLILFLGFHTGPSSDPLFISIGIPAAVSRWEQLLLALAFLALAAFGLLRLSRDTGWRKLLPSLTLFSSQFLWFLLPAGISLMKGWEVPQSRYSTGVLAVMHSAQYLWITSYYARREAAGENRRNWHAWAYFGVLLAGGIALFVPGPWLASRLFHHDFTTSFLIFTALINIHHFILDGAIWKLRDGRIASLLLNSRVRVADVASETGSRLAKAWVWISGGTTGARQLRIGAAVLLLLWGTLDQVRYYWALHADDLKDLRRAAVLDSFDSPLQTRLAREELEQGETQAAESALEAGVRVNPSDPAPRQALLRLLIEQKRFDEAFALTEASLQFAPKDVNLLVDRGLLAQRRGHPEQAVESWRRALAIDPGHPSAHLYLADELDREGRPLEAAAHYTKFLEIIARQTSVNRPVPQQVIAVILRLADCQVRASETAQAIQSYQLARKLSVQTLQGQLESVAAVNEAALQSKSGKLGDALHLYQRALQLDESLGDPTASAEDWLADGKFLDDSGFPVRLVYSCFVKSEKLKDPLPDPEQQQLRADAAKQAAKRAGSEAAAVRRNLDLSVRQALALTVE